MGIKNFVKKIFTVVLILLIANIGLVANANQLRTIQNKQRATHEKIRRLKVLEHLEKNKLYKNQQKLEQASNSLQYSQNQYASLNSQLQQMEKDLAVSIAEFNKANIDMRKRIRQVYKNQRTGMFQLILTAKDLNSLLDVVYFEKIVLKKDYARIMAVRAKSQRIAAMKKNIEAKKIALAQSIEQINSQKQSIKSAIALNQSMISKYKTDRKTYERAEYDLRKRARKGGGGRDRAGARGKKRG